MARPSDGGRSLLLFRTAAKLRRKRSQLTNPLTYKGARFYQASFGQACKLDGLKVLATPNGGTGKEITLRMNEPFDWDANAGVTLAEYIPDFFIRDHEVFKCSDDPVNFRFQPKIKAAGRVGKGTTFTVRRPIARKQAVTGS